jgi:sensor histidine kinase YesM
MTLSHLFGKRAIRHGVVWLLIVAGIGLLAWQDPAHAREGLQSSAVLLAVIALAIYTHFWLLTNLMERQRYGLYALATLATALASGTLLRVLDEVVQIRMTDAKVVPPSSAYLFGQAVGNVLLAVIIATVARYVRRGIVSHFQMQQLRALQLETELSLLKAQVNQHFLFNTLNNLYGLSLAAPDQMPEALLQLAGLMRYQLDSSRQSTVTVGTEAEYLANYIGLEKLRLRENTRVEFTADLPHPDRPLAPLLLLPLVENCFKHAIGPSGENTIRIHLTQTDTGLTLRTGNSIPPHFRPAPSGLGLPNLRARLAQFYPGSRHRLAIEASENFYAVNLQLVL